MRTKLLASLAALLPILLAVPVARATTPTVALWHMDGAPMTDSSGNGNDGLIDDVSVVSGGVSGNAYQFAQSDSHVMVPDSPELDPGTADFSVTVHVKLTVVPDVGAVGDYDLIRKGVSGTVGGEWKMEIVPNSTTGAANPFCLFKDDAGHTDSLRGNQNLADGAWHSITCVKTSTADQLVADGSAMSSRPEPALGSISSAAPVVIGQKWRGGDQYVGLLDEISVGIGGAGTEDATAPTFTNMSPSGHATGVTPATNVTATFSEKVQNVGISTFTLAPTAGGAAVAADYIANAGGTEWTLTPTANLAADTWYTVTLTSGITDAASNPLASAPVTWQYRTGSALPVSPTRPATTGVSRTMRVVVLSALGIVVLAVGTVLGVRAALGGAARRRPWY